MEEEGWSGSGVSEQSGSDREGRTEAGTLLLRPAPIFRIDLSFLHNLLLLRKGDFTLCIYIVF